MADNYYDILGVPRNSTDKDIKSAYRRLARKLHPDVNPGDEKAQAEFKKVNEAYEVLGDEKRRKDYDQFGDNWKHADQMRNMGAGRGGNGGFGFDIGDLFGGGGGFADMFGGMGRQPRGAIRHEGSVQVSLDEVYHGTSRRITIGGGMGASKTIEVQIPAGVPDGRKIRVRPDANSEVTITVRVRDHSKFTRQGSNLRTDVIVPLFDAILGGEVEVPTMTGRIALQIPSGTQNGRSFKIKGKGLPVMNSGEFGDLFATIKVKLPESLTEEEKSHFETLKNLSQVSQVTREE